MKDRAFVLKIIIPHTEPKTRIISALQHATHSMLDGSVIPESIERILLLNNAIFLKSEFAKQSLRIIQECYKKYGKLLEDGTYLVNPLEFFPALREIDNIIFELGSILDFFAREIDIAFKLGIDLMNVGFGRVVGQCKQDLHTEPITKALIEFSDTDSYKYFRGMRNRVMHRLPFVTQGTNDQIFFPDDPDSDDVIPSTENKIDVCETCNLWLHEILSFVDRTSLLVFRHAAKIKILSKETGEELNLEEYFGKEYDISYTG